jgi:hypothetical protein
LRHLPHALQRRNGLALLGAKRFSLSDGGGSGGVGDGSSSYLTRPDGRGDQQLRCRDGARLYTLCTLPSTATLPH